MDRRFQHQLAQAKLHTKILTQAQQQEFWAAVYEAQTTRETRLAIIDAAAADFMAWSVTVERLTAPQIRHRRPPKQKPTFRVPDQYRQEHRDQLAHLESMRLELEAQTQLEAAADL